MTSAIVHGEYITFKHVKTRKVVILEVEVPEELFQDVITKLGMPIGGESKPVAVALLDAGHLKNSRTLEKAQGEQTEGELLRTKAVLLCKTQLFWHYVKCAWGEEEETCRAYILDYCFITSRSELAANIQAQIKFKEILREFDAWKVSQQYADNLNR